MYLNHRQRTLQRSWQSQHRFGGIWCRNRGWCSYKIKLAVRLLIIWGCHSHLPWRSQWMDGCPAIPIWPYLRFQRSGCLFCVHLGNHRLVLRRRDPLTLKEPQQYANFPIQYWLCTMSRVTSVSPWLTFWGKRHRERQDSSQYSRFR